MAKLIDVARILRSKNAGPLYLTFDIMFDEAEQLKGALAAIDEQLIADLYDVLASDVSIIPYEIVNSVKVTIPRKHVSGDLGDDDIYGCAQHVKLCSIDI